MLAEEPLPAWASGRRVVAVGGQSDRPVDDVAAVLDDGGWLMIQAKKGMNIGEAEGGALAKALAQLVDVAGTGVPTTHAPSGALRTIDKLRDRVLIAADQRAPTTISDCLAPLTERLREWPPQVPLAEALNNAADKKAFPKLRTHLERLFTARAGHAPSEGDLRELLALLTVHALRLEDGNELLDVRALLGRFVEQDKIDALWDALLTECQDLARRRSYLGRNELVRRLETHGLALRPLTRFRPDIGRLTALTAATLDAPDKILTVRSPEGPVALSRVIDPVLAQSTGNVAITGPPGAGKTVALYNLAKAARVDGQDVILLVSENLAATAAATQMELGLTHSLTEVLAGWPGLAPGLVLLDGLDQTKAADPVAWVSALATSLRDTRWRIVATTRTFDLQHSPRWKSVFHGDPVATAHHSLDLTQVRHLVVDDLTDAELQPLRDQSPTLARLVDGADPAVRDLLHNVFNLDLAGQLLSANPTLDLSRIHDQTALLHEYWTHRVRGTSSAAGERINALRLVVDAMITDRTQIVNPASPALADHSAAIEALKRDGVLRTVPTAAGHAMEPIGFAHPVLFDYAVSLLALGDTLRPQSLADVLDQHEHFELTLRPSLGYRLAEVWRATPTRNDFWHLALRLASRTNEHVLAASAAARTAGRLMETPQDLAVLSAACTGQLVDQHDRWHTTEAHQMAFLLAGAVSRLAPRSAAQAAIGSFVAHLARHARENDDVALALLAAQLPLRAAGAETATRDEPAGEHWPATVNDCLAVALVAPNDPHRMNIADVSMRLLAIAAQSSPAAVSATVHAVLRPEVIDAWGPAFLWPLANGLRPIAQQAPDLAIAIIDTAWSRDDLPEITTPLVRGTVFAMSSNRSQDLDAIRDQLAAHFAAVVEADPVAATQCFIRIVDAPHRSPYPSSIAFEHPPRPRLSRDLAFSSTNSALIQMTNAVTDTLATAADRQPDSAADGSSPSIDIGQLRSCIALLTNHLANAEVWHKLLHTAATTPSPTLARSLLPALTSPNLYTYPSTWLPAAHVARRIYLDQTDEDRTRILEAVHGLVNAEPRTTSNHNLAEQLQQRVTQIINALRPPTGGTDGAPATLPALSTDPYNRPQMINWSPDSPAPGTPAEAESRLASVSQALTSEEPAQRESAAQNLKQLWSQLHSGGPTPGVHQQMSAVEVDAAYNLAKLSDVTPDSTLGAEVLHTLTQALPPADEGAAADREPPDIESEDSNAEDWDVTAHTRAIDGIAVLLSRDDWRETHAESLRALLWPYLDSDDATSRLCATRAFTYMYPDAASHMEAAATRLRTESNDVIRYLLLSELSQHRFRDPLAIDQTLEQLSDLPGWTCLSQQPDGDARFSDNHGELCIRIAAILACQHETPFATSTVRSWLHDPTRFPSRGQLIATTLRDALNPADPALRQTQERAFSFARIAVDAALARDSAQSANTRPAAESRTVATEFGHQLYFASGAADPEAAPGAPPRRGPARLFARLALPILADLAGIADPRLAHHITKTLDHLRDTQPGRVLAIAATTVTSTEAYARDQIGLQDVSTLIQHALAEYRSLVTSSAEGLAAVRTMLSTFVRLGWDSAIELYEQMNDLNRP